YQPMQSLPAFAQATDAEAVRSYRQGQQPTEPQGAYEYVGTFAQVNQQLLHVQAEQEHGISSDMQHYVGETPQPHLPAHRNPPSPAGQLLQRRHGQGDEQKPERAQPQSIHQNLARIRPQGKYPGLIEPETDRDRRHKENEESPESEPHQ